MKAGTSKKAKDLGITNRIELQRFVNEFNHPDTSEMRKKEIPAMLVEVDKIQSEVISKNGPLERRKQDD